MQTKNYLFMFFAMTCTGLSIASEQVVTVPNEAVLRDLISQHPHLSRDSFFRESIVKEFAGKKMTLTALIKIVNEKPICSTFKNFDSRRFYDSRPGNFYTYPQINTVFFSIGTPQIYAILLNNNPQLLAAKEKAVKTLNSQFRNCSPYK